MTAVPSAGGALPCGVHVDELAAQVVEGHRPADPAHQAVCPYCRATLAELDELSDSLRAVARDTPAVPPSLGSAVMERVSAMATHGWHAVVPAGDGETRIAAWVVALVARRAARTVDGVRQVQGQATPAPAAVAEVRARYAGGPGGTPTRAQQADAMGTGVAGRKVVVTVRMTARPGLSLPGLAADVRRAVATGVRELTGLDVVEVDVHVSDLEDAPDRP